MQPGEDRHTRSQTSAASSFTTPGGMSDPPIFANPDLSTPSLGLRTFMEEEERRVEREDRRAEEEAAQRQEDMEQRAEGGGAKGQSGTTTMDGDHPRIHASQNGLTSGSSSFPIDCAEIQ